MEDPGPERPGENVRRYQLNTAALTWAELNRAGIAMVLVAPYVAWCKLRRKPWLGQVMREDALEIVPVEQAQITNAGQVNQLSAELVALGFEYVGAFGPKDIPGRDVLLGFMNQAQGTYANIHESTVDEKRIELELSIFTYLTDGEMITTERSRRSASLITASWVHVQALPGATTRALWEAHVGALASHLARGQRVDGPLSTEHYVARQNETVRREIKLWAERGVLVPVGETE